MGLIYDFDIFDLTPQGPGPDPEVTGFMARLGLLARASRDGADPPDPGSVRVALFRERATADALACAPDGLRDYFMAAGFGLNTYSSGAPRHCYPAADELARLEVIDRLAALAPRFALTAPEGHSEDGHLFRLEAFLADLAETRPLDPEPEASPRRVSWLPPLFDAQAPATGAPRYRFWQHRFFRMTVGGRGGA